MSQHRSIGEIALVTSKTCGVSLLDMREGAGTSSLAIFARQVAIYVAREFYQHKHSRMIEYFGLRQKGTSVHAIRKIASRVTFCSETADNLAQILDALDRLTPTRLPAVARPEYDPVEAGDWWRQNCRAGLKGLIAGFEAEAASGSRVAAEMLARAARIASGQENAASRLRW